MNHRSEDWIFSIQHHLTDIPEFGTHDSNGFFESAFFDSE
jgi:hypothetical protein